MLTEIRKRISNRLHLWGARVYDDFHTLTITSPDGLDIEFACYWQWTGSWPEGWRYECDCPISL
jgi:hypothetical protein